MRNIRLHIQKHCCLNNLCPSRIGKLASLRISTVVASTCGRACYGLDLDTCYVDAQMLSFQHHLVKLYVLHKCSELPSRLFLRSSLCKYADLILTKVDQVQPSG